MQYLQRIPLQKSLTIDERIFFVAETELLVNTVDEYYHEEKVTNNCKDMCSVVQIIVSWIWVHFK